MATEMIKNINISKKLCNEECGDICDCVKTEFERVFFIILIKINIEI